MAPRKPLQVTSAQILGVEVTFHTDKWRLTLKFQKKMSQDVMTEFFRELIEEYQVNLDGYTIGPPEEGTSDNGWVTREISLSFKNTSLLTELPAFVQRFAGIDENAKDPTPPGKRSIWEWLRNPSV